MYMQMQEGPPAPIPVGLVSFPLALVKNQNTAKRELRLAPGSWNWHFRRIQSRRVDKSNGGVEIL